MPPVKITMTRALAWAAATDAGNRSMRKGGRTAWNEDDYNVAVREFNRLWPSEQMNPAKFDRCVREVEGRAKRGGRPVNAYAVCTAAGARNKKKGKGPVKSALETIGSIGEYLDSSAGKVLGMGNPDVREQFFATQDAAKKYKRLMEAEGYTVSWELVPEVTKTPWKAVARKSNGRRNPADAAAGMYESFHGFPSTKVEEYKEEIHYHSEMSAIGILCGLLVEGEEEIFAIPFSGYEWDEEEEAFVASEFSEVQYSQATNSLFGGLFEKQTTHSPGLMREAYSAGYRGSHGERGDTHFDEWLKRKKPERFDRGFISQLKDEYWKGVKAEEEHARSLPYLKEKLKSGHGKGSSSSSVGGGKEKKGYKLLESKYKGYSIRKMADGTFVVPKIDFDSRLDSLQDAKRFIDDQGHRNPNPQTLAGEEILKEMTLLTCNEEGDQLFIQGGDQSIRLEDVGVEGNRARHEHIRLGDILEVTYHTKKKFDGKLEEYDYFHEFSEDDNGELPLLEYDRVNKMLRIVGGSYVINKPAFTTSPGIEN